MIYEHRTYKATPNSITKLKERFRDHALPLLRKNGIEVVNFWENSSNSSGELIYICRFMSKTDMKRSWERFSKDPWWLEAKEKSEKDGPLIEHIESKILRSVKFFPNKCEDKYKDMLNQNYHHCQKSEYNQK
ncbi:NIPSNAP family protein [Bacillus subtilis]|uniref:NIPSNAP family protein n=1 Tax=Bacillus subtilis TaxID=1423 RepID=A0AAP2M047_BACIU|nr:NIPSNAP family protein [Bacillus subtilis]ASZ60046.1 NIPSNAP family protein [Bacillus subtilis]MBO3767635.1 NIPSNAP family protein [Bacillus subtilis]MCB4339147.1 hypothetical protein [Bacillus subtilis]MEC0323672.1 NIPSNAP family protein [Bacillus subtilis]ODV44773.1 hypothetical protein BCM26_03215 [Bacillus subtilis]